MAGKISNRTFGIRFFTAISLAVISGSVVSASVAAGAAKVTRLDFQSKRGGKSQLSILSDSPVTYEVQENEADKQIVVELKGATLTKPVSRPFDTSSFNSKITLISPYQVKGQADTSRIVINMKEMTKPEVTQEGNAIRLVFDDARAEGRFHS